MERENPLLGLQGRDESIAWVFDHKETIRVPPNISSYYYWLPFSDNLTCARHSAKVGSKILYQFFFVVLLLSFVSFAAVTNNYKIRGISQYRRIILQFQGSEVQNQGVCKALFLLEALGDDPLLAFSSFKRLPAFLGFWPLPLSSRLAM